MIRQAIINPITNQSLRASSLFTWTSLTLSLIVPFSLPSKAGATPKQQSFQQAYTPDSSPEIFYIKTERADETLPVSGPRNAPFVDKSGDVCVSPESLKPLGIKAILDASGKITLKNEAGDIYATKRFIAPSGHPGFGAFVSLRDVIEHYGGRVEYDTSTNSARILSRVTKLDFDGDSFILSTTFPVQGKISQSRDKQQIEIDIPYAYLEDVSEAISTSHPRLGVATVRPQNGPDGKGSGVRVVLNLKERMSYAGVSSQTRTSEFRLTLLSEWAKSRPNSATALLEGAHVHVTSPSSSSTFIPKVKVTTLGKEGKEGKEGSEKDHSQEIDTSSTITNVNSIGKPSVTTRKPAPPVSVRVPTPVIKMTGTVGVTGLSRIYEVSFVREGEKAELEIKADQIPTKTTLPVRFWVKDDKVNIDFWNSRVPDQVIEDLKDSLRDKKTPYGRLFKEVSYQNIDKTASRLTLTMREPVSFLAKMGRSVPEGFRINNGLSMIFSPQVKREELPPVESGSGSYRDGLLGKLVVVDPGHGGSDPGSKGGGDAEKNNTLGISFQVAKQMRDLGANVIMTRVGDCYPSVPERSFIANRTEADYFVSVHCDASDRNTPSGWTVIYKANNAFGKGLAESVHDMAIAYNIPRGNRLTNKMNDTYRGSLSVLRKGQMACFLFEMGFISNSEDRARLKDPEWRQTYGRATAEGVEAFARVNPITKRVNAVSYPDDLGGFWPPKENLSNPDTVTIRL